VLRSGTAVITTRSFSAAVSVDKRILISCIDIAIGNEQWPRALTRLSTEMFTPGNIDDPVTTILDQKYSVIESSVISFSRFDTLAPVGTLSKLHDAAETKGDEYSSHSIG
jgi:hypothetical protein